jgi:competence protein ComGF
MLAVIIIVSILSCKSKNQVNDAIIKVIFSNKQTTADLDSIKENQKLKDVVIIFNKTNFDSVGKLNFIDFNVT